MQTTEIRRLFASSDSPVARVVTSSRGVTPLPRRWQRALKWSRNHNDVARPDMNQIKMMLDAERQGRQG